MVVILFKFNIDSQPLLLANILPGVQNFLVLELLHKIKSFITVRKGQEIGCKNNLFNLYDCQKFIIILNFNNLLFTILFEGYFGKCLHKSNCLFHT